MPTLPLPRQINDAFGAPIGHMFRLIDWMSQQSQDEHIELDYSGCRFAHPFYSVAIPLVIQQFKRRGYQSLILNQNFGNLSKRLYGLY